jgi:hypothetical protein
VRARACVFGVDAKQKNEVFAKVFWGKWFDARGGGGAAGDVTPHAPRVWLSAQKDGGGLKRQSSSRWIRKRKMRFDQHKSKNTRKTRGGGGRGRPPDARLDEGAGGGGLGEEENAWVVSKKGRMFVYRHALDFFLRGGGLVGQGCWSCVVWNVVDVGGGGCASASDLRHPPGGPAPTPPKMKGGGHRFCPAWRVASQWGVIKGWDLSHRKNTEVTAVQTKLRKVGGVRKTMRRKGKRKTKRQGEGGRRHRKRKDRSGVGCGCTIIRTGGRS